VTTAQPRTFPFSEPGELDVDPLLAELRRDEPLSRVQLAYGEPAWLATRYEDARVVLGDPRFSRAAATGRDEPRSRFHRGEPGNIMSLDPPDHSALRRIVSRAFTTRRVEELRPRAQEIADTLAGAMLAQGPPADLVEGFGFPLPTTVICELLGVPAGDRGRFRVWADAFLSTTKFTPAEVGEHVQSLNDYMDGLIAQHREDRRDDLIGVLVAACDDEDRLPAEAVRSLAVALLVAGHETTATQIPNFAYTLLTHPERMAELHANPDLVPQAVEELMRHVPLGGGTSVARYALEDAEVGGVTVRAGEAVVVQLSSANRDESVYSRPDEIDLARQESPHLGFGYGPHHCLGAPLARMELQVAVRTLLARFPGLRLAGTGRDIDWKAGVSTRGPARMLVAWE
jgi:cytochrome P450